MKITLKEIAEELKISTAAASRALNDLPGVSDGLRLKVKQTAQRMGYARYINSSAPGMQDRSIKFVVVLYGLLGGLMIEDIQGTIDERIRKKGYYELRYMIDTTIELHTEETKELFLEKISKERGVVGVLSCYLKLSDVLISKLYEQNVPVVLLENHTDYGRCVTINNLRAAYKATQKLIELGRKTIGCIIPPEDDDHVWFDRLAGYKKALKEAGLPYDPTLIVFENWVAVKPGGLATKALLDRRPDVDAILFGSDRQAYGGLKMLRDLNIRVPDDVALIGFDDEDYNIVMQPSMSSVRQPIKKMAETGMSLLFDAIENGDLSHRAIELDTELTLRGSCLSNFKDEIWF